jgi:hypothetical protein
MKALSVRQPLAWLIVQGHKDIENRTWKTRYRGPFFVHAGAALASDIEGIRRWARRRFAIEIPEDLPRGGIVGVANLDDCVERSRSPWFGGEIGFVLSRARPTRFVPMAGKLGFFGVPAGVARRASVLRRRAKRKRAGR